VHYSKPEEAITYAQEITERYPDSQFMLWAAAHAYHKDGDLQNAAAAYQHLLEIITADADYNPQHLIKCKMKLAEIYCDSEQYERCLLECEQLLLFLQDTEEDKISRVRALMSRCLDNRVDDGKS
jgi:tetratricopeptide (TPR) repeat protein